MHHDERQRLLAIFSLPMTPASNFDGGRDFNLAFFRSRQMNLARHEEAGDRLDVASG